MKNKEKGFTLIELLVVIAIIGMLASTVLVSLSTARAKGRDAKRISDISSLSVALELYQDTYGIYPWSLDVLKTAGYIGDVPKDPTGGFYKYAGLGKKSAPTGSRCVSYHLGAVLEIDNNVLDSDSGGAYDDRLPCTDADPIKGGSSANNFYGESELCIGPSVDPSLDKCYDIGS